MPAEGEPQHLTYGEFADRSERLAAGLAGLGISLGDRIVIHMGNRLEFLLAFFALVRLGAVAVLTNATSAPGEIAYFTSHAGATGIITEFDLLPAVRESGASFQHFIVVDGDVGPASAAVRFEGLFDTGRLEPRAADPGLYAAVLYTSGTTSRPKAVLLTHANLLWGAERNAAHMKLRPDDIGLAFLPLFHINALGYSALGTMWAGGSLVIQPKFSASRFWSVAARHGCTWASIGPFVPLAIADLPVPEHRFRFWGTIWGNDPEVAKTYGIASLGWWGMTETVSHPIISDYDLPCEPRHIGRPAAEYGVTIRRADDSPAGPGETGRLLVRGEPGLSLFAKYMNDEEATTRAFDGDGWFDTGDMVTLHASGDIAFADREKDMLKVGGENVSASEVERVLEGVAGIREAAVVGRKDRFLSEVPVAFVVADGQLDAVKARIEMAVAHELAPFKRPREYCFVDALPRLPIGKTDKKAMRALVNADAGQR